MFFFSPVNLQNMPVNILKKMPVNIFFAREQMTKMWPWTVKKYPWTGKKVSVNFRSGREPQKSAREPHKWARENVQKNAPERILLPVNFVQNVPVNAKMCPWKFLKKWGSRALSRFTGKKNNTAWTGKRAKRVLVKWKVSEWVKWVKWSDTFFGL